MQRRTAFTYKPHGASGRKSGGQAGAGGWELGAITRQDSQRSALLLAARCSLLAGSTIGILRRQTKVRRPVYLCLVPPPKSVRIIIKDGISQLITDHSLFNILPSDCGVPTTMFFG